MRVFRLLLVFVLAMVAGNSFAQVTSASMTGIVADDSLKAVEGAVVRATHEPSGSVYGTATRSNGTFNIQNMRVGGPYTVIVSYGGVSKTLNEIYLNLGEPFDLKTIVVGEQVLKEVQITAAKDPLFNNQRTGASTVISNAQITNLPSISRSVFDMTRLTPQANGQNFMGRDSRYNNLQVNGASINNNFGLSSGFPGGAQAFSLDAVDQIQVAISPYDVKQTSFTGANINIVTRTGTNELSGSVYNYWRNETFQGKYVGDYKLNSASKSIYNTSGFRVGGPIIKNKLFFFINAELDKNTFPESGATWIANGSTANSPNVSRTSKDSLIKLSNYLRDKYQYETGAYEGYAYNYRSNNTRFLARLDYNLNDKNKINFSVTSLNRVNDQPLNARSSTPLGSVTNSRIGAYSMSFENSQYSFKDVVRSYTGEWLSTISNDISNQLLVSYTHVQDTRSTPGSLFPFVDIATDIQNNTDNYISFGSELFSYKNDVTSNSLNVYNNLTVDKGIHHMTGGASFQYLSIGNSFLPSGNLYYRYASLEDFMTPGRAPVAMAYTYPYEGQDGYVRVKYGLGGLYAQDKINVRKNLVVTGGVRLEMPFYFNKLTKNPNIDTVKLLDLNGNLTTYDPSKWPAAKPFVSPRLAFNWTPFADRKIQVRGGTGIFAGQVPFVWFTNQPGNSGTITNSVGVSSAAALKELTFQTNINNYPDSIINKYFPKQPKNSVPGQLAVVANNFKMPRVWRSDLAVDYKLPYGFVASAEFIYTKDIYSVYQYNANLAKPTGTVKQVDTNYLGQTIISPDSTRPYYGSNRVFSGISGAYILENSTKGEAYSFTIGLARSPKNGFFGSLYYTYMSSKDIGPNAGSQAGSAWSIKPNGSSPNETVLGPSDFYVPHRIVGGLSYSISYLKHFRTTIGVYYEGSSGGRYSYTYSADMNGDGVASDLMYIPKDAHDLLWTNNKVVSGSTTKTFTAQEQADAFEKFISQDKYLSSHRGQYAQRNGGQYPYFGSFDAKFLQDIYSVYRKRKYTLQFSVDMLNVGNFLSKNWGLRKRLVSSQLLEARTSNGEVAYYKFRPIADASGNQVLPTSTFVDNYSFGNVWSMQLGLRLLF